MSRGCTPHPKARQSANWTNLPRRAGRQTTGDGTAGGRCMHRPPDGRPRSEHQRSKGCSDELSLSRPRPLHKARHAGDDGDRCGVAGVDDLCGHVSLPVRRGIWRSDHRWSSIQTESLRWPSLQCDGGHSGSLNGGTSGKSGRYGRSAFLPCSYCPMRRGSCGRRSRSRAGRRQLSRRHGRLPQEQSRSRQQLPGLLSRLWPVGTALAMTFTAAKAVARRGLLHRLDLLGARPLKPERQLSASTLFDLVRLAFGVVAGSGAVVALVVAYPQVLTCCPDHCCRRHGPSPSRTVVLWHLRGLP